MIYLNLFATFFKIGMFSFGGGYGMIPLIETEIVAHGWLTAQEFVRIISISEMTPGPIAVNTATLVGYRTAGILGGTAATLGVVLPSLILILSTIVVLLRFRTHPLVQQIICGIKPVVLALIIAAAVFVARNIWWTEDITGFASVLAFAEPVSLAITAISIIFLMVLKVNPIFMLLVSGAIGAGLYYLGIY